MSSISQQCEFCSKSFNMVIGEYNRQTKRGRTIFFCSLSCSTAYKNTNQTKEQRKRNAERLRIRNNGNKHAKKGDFAYYLNKARNRKHESNLCEQYLSSIWTGFCVLSSVPIFLYEYKTKNKLNTASLDRIDSSKGYLQGNVQFVAYGINLAKNNFTDADVLTFLETIRLSASPAWRGSCNTESPAVVSPR